MSQPTERAEFEVAIICALPIEAEAVLALFDKSWDEDGYHLGRSRGDPNAYMTGLMGRHNVVLVIMPEMGKKAASGLASSLNSSFRGIQVVLLVGICGGVPGGSTEEEIILGDVVISTSVIQHDLGRQFPDKFVRKNALEESLGRPNIEIRSLLAKLKIGTNRRRLQERMLQHLNSVEQRLGSKYAIYPGITKDRLFEPSYRHKHHDLQLCETCRNCKDTDDPVCDESRTLTCQQLNCQGELISRRRLNEALQPPHPVVHFGSIASGDTVMKSGTHRDDIASREGVIAFEMEGAGVWDHLPCIVVKGICDYADSHKDKSWQHYAAGSAAACAKSFLNEWVSVNNQPLSMLSLPHSEPLSRKRKASTQLIRLEVDASAPINMIPFQRDDSFVGRKDALDATSRISAKPGSRVALYGIGGVGKSQIAIEFCYQYRSMNPEDHVLWVHASSQSRFESSYLDIARQLKLHNNSEKLARTEPPVQEILDSVLKWLKDDSQRTWLMVVDNADNEELFFGPQSKSSSEAEKQSLQMAIARYLPGNSRGTILVTTRNMRVAHFATSKNMIPVQPLDSSSALELLRQNMTSQRIYDEREANELLQFLDYLPLAISQAAAYMIQEGVDLRRYLGLLRESSTSSQSLFEQNYYDPRRELGMPNAVFLTWRVTFDDISKRKPRAAEVLSLMAFLDRQSIPTSLLLLEGEDQINFDTAIGTLKAFCLINEEMSLGTFEVHRLVQACTQRWLDARGKSEEWKRRASLVILNSLPSLVDFEHWPSWQSMVPHAEAVLEHTSGDAPCLLERASILINVASFERKRGRVQQSVEKAQEGLKLFQILLGKEHLDTASAMEVLAMGLRSNQRYLEAEDLSGQAFALRQKVQGEHHSDTLAAARELINVLVLEERFEQSEMLCRQILASCEQGLGVTHPETTSIMNYLGLILSARKKDLEAETIFKRTLEDSEIIVGEAHRDTLAAKMNLGVSFFSQGRYGEAEVLLEEVLQLSERVLGKEHPDSLRIKANLGSVLYASGKLEAAKEVREQTLESHRRVLGDAHATTLASERKFAQVIRRIEKIARSAQAREHCF